MPPRRKEPDDYYAIQGLPGHWHRTLELPCGYQHFNWYKEGYNDNDVVLNRPDALVAALEVYPKTDLLLYTHHEVFYEEGIIKHTRSSPQWEGGIVTYSTCKHLMRSTNRQWEGVWLVGLTPIHCEQNTMMFAGRIDRVFSSNFSLHDYLAENCTKALVVKKADNNPRGDIYTPKSIALARPDWYKHGNFNEPPNHTRSVEFYKKSPGSTSNRPDGKIPKWWRDLEYTIHNNRPPSFILSPVYLFSKPMLWTTFRPRRAVMKLTPATLSASLRTEPVKGA